MLFLRVTEQITFVTFALQKTLKSTVEIRKVDRFSDTFQQFHLLHSTSQLCDLHPDLQALLWAPVRSSLLFAEAFFSCHWTLDWLLGDQWWEAGSYCQGCSAGQEFLFCTRWLPVPPLQNTCCVFFLKSYTNNVMLLTAGSLHRLRPPSRVNTCTAKHVWKQAADFCFFHQVVMRPVGTKFPQSSHFCALYSMYVYMSKSMCISVNLYVLEGVFYLLFLHSLCMQSAL